MDSGQFKLRVLTILLLIGVLISSTMATCSNDRLEKKVNKLTKQLESGAFDDMGASATGIAPRGLAATPTPDTPTPTTKTPDPGATPQAVQLGPGDESPVIAIGWGGRRAKVTYVEGAVPNAPLRLRDKPHPQNDELVNRQTSAPASLNYYTSNEGQTSTITKYVYGRMMNIDPDAPPGVDPELATSWEISDDKLTYTYHLRKGVQFADGRPFTAKDVKFAFDVMRDPKIDAAHMRASFEDVESLEAVDDHTVVVKYTKRFWKGLYSVGYSLRVLNKAWYEEQIPLYAEKLEIKDHSVEPGRPGFAEVFNEMRVPCPGAGPYYLPNDEAFTKEGITLVQNPFYWGMQVTPTYYNFPKQRWIFIQDRVSAFEAFRKKQFDITVLDKEAWEDEYQNDTTITDIANYYEYDHMALHCSFITWNCRRPPFDDPRVRVAMTHLVNRQWILDEIERGSGTVAVCNSKRSYATYSPELIAKPFDVEKAKALLAEAGWVDTDGDGILDKGGKPLEFEFKVPSVRQFFHRVGGLLEDACKQAGINMTLRPLEWSTFIEDYYERRWDAICLYNSWADPWIDPYESYHSSQDTPQGGNGYGWHNDEVDRLCEAMREEFDEDKRTEMFHRLNKLFYDEQPQTLLIHGLVSVLASNRFEDLKVRPTGMQIFDIWVKPENVLHK